MFNSINNNHLHPSKPHHIATCNCSKCRKKYGKMYEEEFDHGIIYDRYERKKKLRKDQRKRIYYSIKKAPFRYICHIGLKDGTLLGTGTLIGPRTVLTAAHVIWDDYWDEMIDISDLLVTPAKRGKSKPPLGVSSTVTKAIEGDGYKDAYAVTKRDYAIIHLKKALGNKIGYWSMSYKRWPFDRTGVSMVRKGLPLGPGRLKVNLSGYPVDKHDGHYQYWTYNYTSNRTDLKGDGMLQYLNDTFAGHSGSPVWVRRHASMGGRVLVGIHVGYLGDKATDSNPNRAVYLSSSVRSFIKKYTK